MMPESYFISQRQYAPARKQSSDAASIRIFNEHLYSILPEDGHPLAEAASHHFSTKGKQLRAKIALDAGDAFAADLLPSLHWASAVELLHNASLIHDDMCDGDSIRRNKASVWAKYGRDIALALGDWMIAESFEQAAIAARISGSFNLVSKLATHVKSTIAGQALEFDNATYPNIDKYLKISAGKTAPLFVAAIDGIAEISGRTDLIDPIGHYFAAMGVCYQFANDIQNIIGTDGAASPSSDLKRRAPNAVIVYFRSSLETQERVLFDNWLAGKSQHKANHWQQKMIESGAIIKAADEMNKLLTKAEGYSGTLPSECSVVIAPIQSQLRHVCAQIGAACPKEIS
jgi:geranylgeranyl pyrophosphate synthase